MRFKLDENLPAALAELLRSANHDFAPIAELLDVSTPVSGAARHVSIQRRRPVQRLRLPAWRVFS
jgi:hypothetical protein